MDRYGFLWSVDEEEEERRRFGGGSSPSFGTSTEQTGLGNIFTGGGQYTAPRERNFMERVIAPFEAPQQFLFSMTREVDEDGFQVSDLWKSISHGANYFNPFSNAERIDEDEIRQILFGPDAEGAKRTFKTSAVNLGISLLYDPLWMVPVAGAAGKAGLIGRRTAGALQRIADPGMLAMDAIGAGARGTSKVVGNVVSKAIGAEEAATLSTKLQQRWINRWAGVQVGEREALGKFDMNIQEWSQRAAEIYREGRKLSPDTQNIVTRMLESNAIYTSRYLPEVPLRPKQRAEIGSLLTEAASKGIDENLLWDVYSKANKLEMDIMDNLIRTQRVTQQEAKELYGRHLRRMYTVFDDPTAGLERIDKLLARAQTDPTVKGYVRDSHMFDRQALGRALDGINTDLADAFPLNAPRYRAGATEAERAMSTTVRQNVKETSRVGVGDYFMRGEDGVRKFDTETFLTDFGYYLNENPQATIAEAVDHVKRDMFRDRFDNPQFMEVLSNYLAKGHVETRGIESWQNILQQGKASSGINFRTYREHVERIADRQAIPDFIRKEVLGEPESFIPRIIDDAVIAAKEAEMTDLFDTIAGANRLSASTIDDLMKAADDPQAFAAIVAREGLTDAQKVDLARVIKEAGTDPEALKKVITFGDSEWSSAVRTEKFTYQLSSTGNFGSLSGRFVTPGLAAHLENVGRMMDIGMTKPEGMMHFMADRMADLTSNFKFLKIVADAGANFRDAVGSILQIDIIGGTPFSPNNVRKAVSVARDWMGGRTNVYTDSARRIGYNLMESGFTGVELQNIVGRELRDSVIKSSKNWVDEGTDLFRRFQEGAGDFKRNASTIYQFRENVLRSYVYVSKYDELAERMARKGTDVLLPEVQEQIARQAAAITDRSLFNYADVPYAVEFSRRYGIAPFLTFPFKAGPQLVDSLYNNPLRILKYDRVMNGWNEHWAGGPEAFAAEVQALPDHKRQAMVLRLPGEDKEGQPLYLDLSYFLPWYAVRDLAKDAQEPFGLFKDPTTDLEEARGAIAGDTGMRSSIFTPLVVQLIQALGANQDGLGRPIVDATDTGTERAYKIGSYMYQFMAPPTFVGGTTADSVGRAMQAVARTSPEPMNWVDFIGTSVRTLFNQGNEDAVNRYRERPTTRALVGADEGSAATFGNALGSLFLNVSASNPRRQTRNERIATDVSNTELQREIAQIRVNRNMSMDEKRERIERLQEMIRNNRLIARMNINAMRQ